MKNGTSTIIMQIKALQPELTKAESQVAQCIVDNPENVIHYSVTDLAVESRTSDATVIRACKKLGFSSYQEFKVLLAQSIVSPIQTINGNINDCKSPEDVINHVFNSSIQTLQLTNDFSQTENMIKAAERLLSSDRIFIIGMGNSAAIGMDFQHKLTRLGLTAIVSSDSHMQRIAVSSLAGPKDTVVAISYSGSSTEIIETSRIAREAGASVITLTSYGKSPLLDYATIPLCTVADETKYNLTAITSRFAQMAVLDALSMLISVANEQESIEHIRKVNKAMASLKV